jgi:hypothetical protein
VIPEWLRAKIFGRRYAWQRLLLDGEGKVSRDAEIVLKDLARFCRAHQSTAVFSRIRGSLDPLASARADGRREVYLRIVENLHLDERFLVNLREGANDND